jgi:5-deoxy-glucuronate isomerase
MPRLHLRPAAPDRNFRTLHVTPESAGWEYVGFDLHRIPTGETATGETGDREVCLVFVSGSGTAKAGGKDFGTLGGRADPFSGKPHSLYVPAGSGWSVTAAIGDVELAVCSAPGIKDARGPRVIGPDSHPARTPGKGSKVR